MADVETGGVQDVKEDIGESPSDKVRRWRAEIAMADTAVEKWHKAGDLAVSDYRDEDADRKEHDRRFNIVWSNTETLAAALFQAPPAPLVSRRITDERIDDKRAREVASIIERGIAFLIDDDFTDVMLDVLQDFLLPGRGVVRERYIPTFGPGEQERRPVDFIANELDDQGALAARRFFIDGEPVEDVEGDDGTLEGDLSDVPEDERPFVLGETGEDVVVHEESRTEYVYWKDYRESPARRWADVRWVSYEYRLSKSELKDQFGDAIANQVKLDWSPVGADKESDLKEFFKKATVYDIWDKESKTNIVIAKGYGDAPLRDVDDPLELEGFFPQPKTLDFVTTTNKRIPRPLLAMYRDQSDELDRITARIDKLIDQLKVRGIYDASMGALAEVFKKDDGELVGVHNMVEVPDLSKKMSFLPLAEIVQVLQVLYAQRDQVKQTIYEITGLSDILRGSTDPNETLGAQSLKARFGALRHQRPRAKVEAFIREDYRLKAEIIAEHFSQETLQRMTGVKLPTEEQRAEAQQIVQMQGQGGPQQPPTNGQPGPPGPNGGQPAPPGASGGQQVPPELLKLAKDMAELPTWEEVMSILRDDGARAFAVDIETENTALTDENEEQKRRIEAMTALTEAFEKWLPAVRAGLVTPNFFRAVVMFLMRPFRVGRELEDALDEMMRKMEQAPQQQDAGADAAKAEAEAAAEDRELELAKVKGDFELRGREADRKDAELDVKTAETVAGMMQ